MSGSPSHEEYDETFVAGLEWMWGDGFLSPGGGAEVAAILDGIDPRGARLLDIGCGIGGVDLLLVREHGAARVTGIDVEAPLIEQGRARIAHAGLADRIDLEQVEPGPLPFADASFDLVFSKDAMIHIPDKCAIYTEIHRVLRPGGALAFSDWFGSAAPPTPELDRWLEIVGLTFRMRPIEEAAALLGEIGFAQVTIRDRNRWYLEWMDQELARLSGAALDGLARRIGREAATQRRHSSLAKLEVVRQGQLRPGHVRARKPD